MTNNMTTTTNSMTRQINSTIRQINSTITNNTTIKDTIIMITTITNNQIITKYNQLLKLKMKSGHMLTLCLVELSLKNKL
jgi:hypothetical protein